MGYRDGYLNSPHWNAVRNRYRATHAHQCVQCGATSGLDLHHKTYANIGHEQDSDLEYLCRSCHKRQHGQSGDFLEFLGVLLVGILAIIVKLLTPPKSYRRGGYKPYYSKGYKRKSNWGSYRKQKGWGR